MATIRDVAKTAGVSVGTASRALTGNGYVAEKTKKLVMETAAALGYQHKERRHLHTASKAVGVVLPDITFPFYGAFLKYAEIELNNRGYKTFICNSYAQQNRIGNVLDMVERNELDGLIINADVTEQERRRMEKLPVVSFERILGDKIPMVSSDHRKGGQLAARELLAAGCKNVLILTVKHSNLLFGDYRVEECKKRLQENGTNVTVIELPLAMLSFRYGRDVAAEYLSMYRNIDGIFSDDIIAYCFIFEAVNRGIRIPEQIKVVGYDGNELAQIVTPHITTVVQDIPKLTYACTDMLSRHMRGERVEAEALIPVSLRKGGTT